MSDHHLIQLADTASAAVATESGGSAPSHLVWLCKASRDSLPSLSACKRWPIYS